ncbi:MAG: hypothetical protein WC069_02625 [Candidatus Shapirobacteria bacterium]
MLLEIKKCKRIIRSRPPEIFYAEDIVPVCQVSTFPRTDVVLDISTEPSTKDNGNTSVPRTVIICSEVECLFHIDYKNSNRQTLP